MVDLPPYVLASCRFALINDAFGLADITTHDKAGNAVHSFSLPSGFRVLMNALG